MDKGKCTWSSWRGQGTDFVFVRVKLYFMVFICVYYAIYLSVY